MARPRSAPAGADAGRRKSIRVASTNADPLAALRITPVTVTLGDRAWTVPKLPAVEWLWYLLDDTFDPEDLFPGLAGPDAVIEVNRLVLNGTIPAAELSEAILDLIEAASGRQWWITLRLCRFLRTNWDQVGGELARQGVSANDVSLAHWLDGAYATIIALIHRSGDLEVLGQFSTSLVAPPPGRAKAAFDLKSAQAAFRSAMQRARR